MQPRCAQQPNYAYHTYRKYTVSPWVRNTSLQGTKCWFPMVSAIEGSTVFFFIILQYSQMPVWMKVMETATNLQLTTSCVCPWSVAVTFPVSKSQTLMSASPLPLTTLHPVQTQQYTTGWTKCKIGLGLKVFRIEALQKKWPCTWTENLCLSKSNTI